MLRTQVGDTLSVTQHNNADGVLGLTQAAIKSGASFTATFKTAHRAPTGITRRWSCSATEACTGH